jgi:hypothetical protein
LPLPEGTNLGVKTKGRYHDREQALDGPRLGQGFQSRAKRQLLADGVDPIEAKISAKDAAAKEARERQTYRQAADEFLKLHPRRPLLMRTSVLTSFGSVPRASSRLVSKPMSPLTESAMFRGGHRDEGLT